MRVLVAGTVLLLGLQACGGGSGGGSGGGAGTAATPIATSSPTTAADCAAVVPATVVDGLGWSSRAAPAYDLGTCALTTSNGKLTVQRQPEASRAALDERCAVLDADGGPGERVGWLGDVPACAVVPDGGVGVGVLLALARDDLLVELRIAPTAPTAPDAVRDALVGLARAAADRL